MKKIFLCVVAAMFASICLEATGGGMKAIDAKDKAAIEARVNEFIAAWNVHDAKAMAATFAENADLINPFGKNPSGRVEIEKLFVEEQGGVMKGSTYTLQSTAIREISPGVALADWDGTVTGMTGPDGQAVPAFPHHVTTIFVKAGGKWWNAAGRAYAYLPPPGK